MADPERRFGSIGRRYSDRKWPRHARDFWLLAITVVLYFAVSSALDASHHADRAALDARNAVHGVQKGREVGGEINCAVVSAVSEAGRQQIANGGRGLPPRLERFLHRHGYPSRQVLAREAQKNGRLYVRSISERVHRLVGHKGDGLIRSDGTINCKRLARLAETRDN